MISKLNKQKESLLQKNNENMKEIKENIREKFKKSFKLVGNIEEWKDKIKEMVNNFLEGDDRIKYAFKMINTERDEKLILKGNKIKYDIEKLISATNKRLESFLSDYKIEIKNEIENNYVNLKHPSVDFSNVLSEVNLIRISQDDNIKKASVVKPSEIVKQTSFVSIDNSKNQNFMQTNKNKKFKSNIALDKKQEKSFRNHKYPTVTNMRITTDSGHMHSGNVSPGKSFRKMQQTLNDRRPPTCRFGYEISFKKPEQFNLGSYKVTRKDITMFNNGVSRSPERQTTDFISHRNVNYENIELDDNKMFMARNRSRNRDTQAENKKVMDSYHNKAQKSKIMQILLKGKHRKTLRALFDNKLKELELSYGGKLNRDQKKPFRSDL